VHAAGKPINRAGDAAWDADAVLHRTAELTIGYSGAELANLLNEAAILMARGPRPAAIRGNPSLVCWFARGGLAPWCVWLCAVRARQTSRA